MNAESEINERLNRGLRFSLQNLLIFITILALAIGVSRVITIPQSKNGSVLGFIVVSTALTGLGISVWCRKWQVILFGILVLVLIGLLLPSNATPKSHSTAMKCRNNMKQLILACHNFESAHGRFPETAGTNRNADAKFPHSWRIAILPYVDHERLYARYRFDEPWDGPNNSQLADQMPDVFECPAQKNRTGGYTTPYVAVTGPGTIFAEDRPGKLRDTSGIGQSNMIAILECPDTPVHWMKPDDLSLDEAIAIYSMVAPNLPKASHGRSCNVCMVDGSTSNADCQSGQFLTLLRNMKEAEEKKDSANQ